MGMEGSRRLRGKEYDVFWVEGVPVHRLTKKNGKELSPEEQKKENEEIDKEVVKAKEKRGKADAEGQRVKSARR